MVVEWVGGWVRNRGMKNEGRSMSMQKIALIMCDLTDLLAQAKKGQFANLSMLYPFLTTKTNTGNKTVTSSSSSGRNFLKDIFCSGIQNILIFFLMYL